MTSRRTERLEVLVFARCHGSRMPLERTISIIERGIRAGLHIGAQLCVLRDGAVAAEVAVGEARPGVAMTRDTVMLWLSSCKPLTAAAVGQLWERGKIGIDDLIARWIPEYGNGGKEAATIRQALMHTAGVPNVETGWPRAGWEEILAKICAARQPVGWIPGEQAGYNALTSWYLLGEIVRRVDGRMIHDYVREEVLEPLGLKHSWLAITREEYERLGTRLGVMQNSEPARHAGFSWDTVEGCTNPRPSGSGHGPIRELAWFYEALRRGGELNGGRILQAETVAEMTRRQRVGMKDRSFGRVIDWGLGVMVNSWGLSGEKGEGSERGIVPYQYGPYASRESFGHGGYQSSVGFCDPGNALAVGLVFNGCCGEERHNARAAEVLTVMYEEMGLGGKRS